jgi:hypothetical protein
MSYRLPFTFQERMEAARESLARANAYKVKPPNANKNLPKIPAIQPPIALQPPYQPPPQNIAYNPQYYVPSYQLPPQPPRESSEERFLRLKQETEAVLIQIENQRMEQLKREQEKRDALIAKQIYEKEEADRLQRYRDQVLAQNQQQKINVKRKREEKSEEIRLLKEEISILSKQIFERRQMQRKRSPSPIILSPTPPRQPSLPPLPPQRISISPSRPFLPVQFAPPQQQIIQAPIQAQPQQKPKMIDGVCGLKNNNNFCFVNTILQLLYRTPFIQRNLRQLQIEDGPPADVDFNNNLFSVMDELRSTVDNEIDGRQRIINMLTSEGFKLYQDEYNIDKEDITIRQNDSEQTLNTMLDLLYTLYKNKVNVSYKFAEIDRIHCISRNLTYFENKGIEKIVQDKGVDKLRAADPSFILRVSFKEGKSLAETIENYFVEETTVGQNLDECKSPSDPEGKNFKIKKFLDLQGNDTLFVVIKRYGIREEINKRTGEKTYMRFFVDTPLAQKQVRQINPYTSTEGTILIDQVNSDGSSKYDYVKNGVGHGDKVAYGCIGCICYKGNGRAGHYTFIKFDAIMQIEYEISDEEIIKYGSRKKFTDWQRYGYIFLYKRKPPLRENVPPNHFPDGTRRIDRDRFIYYE